MSGRKRVAVLISGGGSNLGALLKAVEEPGFPAKIVLVVASSAHAHGLERAANAGVPSHVLDHHQYASREAYDAALQTILQNDAIDLICLAGFMRLLTAAFVGAWEGRMLNIHPSLLPAYKGLHTHRRVLAEGARFTGCTVHFVAPEMDAGPIVLQAALPVLAEDDEQSLAARVLAAEHRIYPQALRWLAEGALRVEGQRVIVDQASGSEEAVFNPALSEK